MYNWDDPINDALSKPDIVPEKKVAPEISTDSSQVSADVENFPTSKDNGVGSTGMEDIEQGAARIQVDDKAIINCRADLNQLVPFKYEWAWQSILMVLQTIGCLKKFQCMMILNAGMIQMHFDQKREKWSRETLGFFQQLIHL